eukprot:scaffold2093_cov161-Amphora_coffeaeformis.AAC.14
MMGLVITLLAFFRAASSAGFYATLNDITNEFVFLSEQKKYGMVAGGFGQSSQDSSLHFRAFKRGFSEAPPK